MPQINPFLWFDKEAEEAAAFYVSLFPNSRVERVSLYGENTPGDAGSVMTVGFEIDGLELTALNGGPIFSFTPATSFFVDCDSKDEVERIWARLSEGGKVLMELARYPFSETFGWVSDRYGLSWQLNLGKGKQTRRITPFLTFVGEQQGKAEQAMHSYVARFPGSSVEYVERFGEGELGEVGTVKHARFSLGGQEFMAMDGNLDHHFTFTPAFSFYVNCRTQGEVDAFWDGLSEGGEKGQCGWLTDRYGISWQIVPVVLGEMMQDQDEERVSRVTQAMLKMTKLDIVALERVFEA